jgi:hypothetical protein
LRPRVRIRTIPDPHRGNGNGPADVTLIARHTFSVATLSPTTTLTITCPANNEVWRSCREPRELPSHQQIPPRASAHRCADGDRLGELENIEATASAH